MTQRLFVMCGLSFSGKSTFARALAAATGYVIVAYDELFETLPRSGSVTGLAEWQLIVEAVHERTRQELAAGRSVIVDNLNEDTIDRGALRTIANDYGAESVLLYADTPADVIETRRRRNEATLERGTTSDAEFAFVKARFEPPDNEGTVIRLLPGDDVVERVRAIAL